ncbi:FecR domain-containing protein, partial [Candidatus Peregrinibacteria bacterium]|nr:FecR domain-containing protein [Candidatus Peregrinibacteria bacterium]
MKKDNFDNLEQFLSEGSTQNWLSEENKSSMLASIQQCIALSEKLAAIGEEKFLTEGLKRRMLNSIRETVEDEVEKPFWQGLWIFRNWRSSVASMLILMLAFSVVIVSPFELRTTRAAKWTFLTDVRGEVFVNRDGRTMAVDRNFVLDEGDLIFTREESFVTIRYLDDSVTRLGNNTSMEIKRLYVRPDNAVQTEVELQLISGQIWAAVYNLIDDDSHFIVETNSAKANVSSKAAFELTAEPNSTKLAVFDNVVDLTDKQGTKQAQPILSGFKAEVTTTQKIDSKNLVATIVVEKNSDEDDWVKLNLNLDKEHAEQLKEESIQLAANTTAVDESLVGTLADIKANTKALFANPDIEKVRQKFLNVQVGFLKAEKLLETASQDNDNRRQATPLIIQYKTAVREIMEDYDRLKEKDADQAQRLLAWMKEEIGLQKKSLSLTLPGEKLFLAKEAIVEVEANFARTPAQKSGYYLDISSNRLMEMKGMIANNNLNGAEGVLKSYLSGLEVLVGNVEKANVDELQSSLFALLNAQIKQFKLLTSIEEDLLAKEADDLADRVRKVKLDSVTKLVSIVKTYYKNGIPMLTVLDLKNTV